MDQRKLPVTVLRALYGALIGAGCLLGAVFPPALLVTPGILAFLAVGWGAVPFVAGLAAFAVGSYFLLPLTGLLNMLLLCFPAALAIALLILRRKPYRAAAAVSAAVMAAALYAIVCLPGVLAGRGPAAAVLDTMELMRKNMLLAMPASSATGQIINQIFDAMAQTLSDVLVAGLALMGMVTGGLGTLLCRTLARRAGARLRPMARLERWRLGRGFTAGAIILLLGSLAISVLKLSYAAPAAYVIQTVVVLPLVLQGVALMDYIANRSRSRAGARAGYIIVIVLLLPMSVLLAAGIGAVEQLFQIRRRLDDASRGGIAG